MVDEIPNTERAASGVGRIPSGLFILTAAHEDRRTGMLASWVQQVSFIPLMVSVAVAKGRSIMPLISDARQFALCQVGKDDKILMRKFASGVSDDEDPFLGLDLVQQAGLNTPVLANAIAWVECDLARHFDVEGDHDLFIGTVRDGNAGDDEPFVHIRTDGSKY